LTQFYEHANNIDGLHGECIDCSRKYGREWNKRKALKQTMSREEAKIRATVNEKIRKVETLLYLIRRDLASGAFEDTATRAIMITAIANVQGMAGSWPNLVNQLTPRTIQKIKQRI
jgi:hypothetical protein